jgi:hypothetical protein
MEVEVAEEVIERKFQEEDEDIEFSPEALKRIHKSIQHAREGNVKSLDTPEDIKQWLGL